MKTLKYIGASLLFLSLLIGAYYKGQESVQCEPCKKNVILPTKEGCIGCEPKSKC